LSSASVALDHRVDADRPTPCVLPRASSNHRFSTWSSARIWSALLFTSLARRHQPERRSSADQ